MKRASEVKFDEFETMGRNVLFWEILLQLIALDSFDLRLDD